MFYLMQVLAIFKINKNCVKLNNLVLESKYSNELLYRMKSFLIFDCSITLR